MTVQEDRARVQDDLECFLEVEAVELDVREDMLSLCLPCCGPTFMER